MKSRFARVLSLLLAMALLLSVVPAVFAEDDDFVQETALNQAAPEESPEEELPAEAEEETDIPEEEDMTAEKIKEQYKYLISEDEPTKP